MLYTVKVEKNCESTITVQADNQDHAKELAEKLKYHMQLIWK